MLDTQIAWHLVLRVSKRTGTSTNCEFKWTEWIQRPNVGFMGNRQFDAKVFAIIAALLAVSGALFLLIRRRKWTDHNVSDPGVTL